MAVFRNDPLDDLVLSTRVSTNLKDAIEKIGNEKWVNPDGSVDAPFFAFGGEEPSRTILISERNLEDRIE